LGAYLASDIPDSLSDMAINPASGWAFRSAKQEDGRKSVAINFISETDPYHQHQVEKVQLRGDLMLPEHIFPVCSNISGKNSVYNDAPLLFYYYLYFNEINPPPPYSDVNLLVV
jgi:hypothetical protein